MAEGDLIPEAVALIKAFEGCAERVPGRIALYRPYRCAAGVLTIGYGHTNALPPRFETNARWTVADCDGALRADLARCRAEVERIVGPGLAPHELGALVSFHFNTGGLARSSIPARLARGEPEAVAAVLRRWVRAKGRILPGLVRRREAEALMFRGDLAGALARAGVPVREMARRVDVPRPPSAAVAAEGAAAALGAGATAVAAGTGHGLLALVLGAAMAVAALVMVLRWRRAAAAWR